MKAFEDWNQSHSNCGNIMCPDMICSDCEDQRKIIREEGWRAALKFSLQCLQEQYEGGPSAYDAINREINS